MTSHVKVTAPVTDALLANKAWDHARPLTTAMGLAAHLSANILPGYTFQLNGVPQTTITYDLSPVIGITNLSWEEPITPITPTQPTQPSYTPTPTPQTPTPTYTNTVAGRTGGALDRAAGGPPQPGDPDFGPRGYERGVERGVEPGSPHFGPQGYELLGLSIPLVEVYGASVSVPILRSLLLSAFATILGLAVVFFLFRRKKRKRV